MNRILLFRIGASFTLPVLGYQYYKRIYIPPPPPPPPPSSPTPTPPPPPPPPPPPSSPTPPSPTPPPPPPPSIIKTELEIKQKPNIPNSEQIFKELYYQEEIKKIRNYLSKQLILAIVFGMKGVIPHIIPEPLSIARPPSINEILADIPDVLTVIGVIPAIPPSKFDFPPDISQKANIPHIPKIPFDPDEQIKLKATKEILLKLVQNDREVPNREYKYYIRQQENLQQFCQNYTLNLQSKKKIKEYCNGMIPVRGDGNCFYTAFGFQLLQYFLSDQGYYEQIKNKYQDINVQMEKNFQNMINDKEIGQHILKKFFLNIEQLLQIKDKVQQNKQLFKRFAAFEQEEEEEGQVCDGLFNAQTVIFLRNLAFKLVMESEELRNVVFDKENLLKWEKECNNNEPIIKLLADNLKIHVNLFFFDNKEFNLMEYGKENDKIIILLMRPGHYNIGIKHAY